MELENNQISKSCGMNFEEFFNKFHSLMKLSSFKYILADDKSIDKNSHKVLAVAKQIDCPICSNFLICSFNLSLNVR